MDKAKKTEESLQEPIENQSANSPLPIHLDEASNAINIDQSKIQELTDSLQRLQADFENYKKRTEKDAKESVKYSNANLIGKFLPVLDTLDVAIKNASKDIENPLYAKGMEMLRAQLISVLQTEGLIAIHCVGKKFDPHYHDVMLQEASEKGEGVVLEEFQKGYLLHNKILRHSKVKISK